MTIAAQLALPRRQHRVVRFSNVVITMTLATFGPLMLLERMFVFAAIKQTGVSGVAKITTLAHLREPWRTRRVVAVASIARRRAQIAALQQRAAMHAVAIFRKLRRRERRPIRACESGHNLGISVARTARLRHALRVDF